MEPATDKSIDRLVVNARTRRRTSSVGKIDLGDTVPGFDVRAIDTTGAGDAFWGAFLFSFGKLGKKIEELDFSELHEIARFANAAAALCVTKTGAISAMPRLSEIEKLLKKRAK